MGSAAGDIIALYERHAHTWDADRKRTGVSFEKPWLDRLIALLRKSGTVLDIGCGTGGPIAEYMIKQGFDVTGIDSSPTMIAICRGRFPLQQWLIEDMRTLLLGRRFDGLIAWDSFFHLTYDDQRRMFPIFRDHAAAGAALLFNSGPRHGEGIGEFHGDPLYHASLAPAEYRDLLAANGFVVVTERMEDPDCGGHSVWPARCNKAG